MYEAILSVDLAILSQLNAMQPTAVWDPIMIFLSGKLPWIFVAVGWLAIILYTKNKKALRIFLVVLVAVGLADLIAAYLLKPLIDRLRPCWVYEWIRSADGCGGKFSFPSNHATNAMTIAAAVTLWVNRKIGAFLIFLAVAIGLSRVYLGVHYPSDIVGGFVFGWLVVVALNPLVNDFLGHKKN